MSVNYMWGTSGVGYNEAKIKERDAGRAASTASRCSRIRRSLPKFAKCGVSVLDAPSEIVGTVLIYLGQGRQQRKAGRSEGR